MRVENAKEDIFRGALLTWRRIASHHCNMSLPTQLVLASSSVHRRELLQRLRIPFECHPPDIDETPGNNETASALVARLARAKAQKVGGLHPGALVIGSDEVAALHGRILAKPEDHADAVRQLEFMSGQQVDFLTGLCLLNSASKREQVETVTVQVHFRQLTQTEIRRYLETDRPYGCSGSFRSEAGGITLVHRISSDDNTALLGLPLIALQKMLRNEGYEIP